MEKNNQNPIRGPCHRRNNTPITSRRLDNQEQRKTNKTQARKIHRQ